MITVKLALGEVPLVPPQQRRVDLAKSITLNPLFACSAKPQRPKLQRNSSKSALTAGNLLGWSA